MGATKLQRGRPRHALLHNGIAALAFGALCLALPLLLDRWPALRPLGGVMRLPAAVGLALGAVLLALHVAARRHPRPAAAPVAAGASTPPPRTGTDEWSVDLFDQMDAQGFEAVCQLLFAQGGFMTRALPDSAGGGADLCLYSKHVRGPAAVVRCRHESGGRIDVDELCGLFGLMVAHQVKRGSYVTNARFTPDARQFAQANGINLLDGERLLALIAARTAPQRAELLAAAYERV